MFDRAPMEDQSIGCSTLHDRMRENDPLDASLDLESGYQAVVLPSWLAGVAGSLARTFAHYKGQASTRTKDRYKSQNDDENSHT